MRDGARGQGIFYGWWVVGAFSVTTFMSTGVRHAVGPFLKPIVADLNLDRGSFSAVIALSLKGQQTAREPARQPNRYSTPVAASPDGSKIVAVSVSAQTGNAVALSFFRGEGRGRFGIYFRFRLIQPFFRLHEAFLGSADRLEVFAELVLIAFREPGLKVARFIQHMIEDATSATDFAEHLGLIGRAVLGKELGESIDDASLCRHHAAAIGPAEY